MQTQVRPAAEIDRRRRERFVHGHQEISGAQNAALRAQRLAHRLAENDARVLDGVVLIHFEIAARVEFQIHRAVPRHERQHVIEKRNAGGDFRAALAVEIQAHANVRFGGGAAQIALFSCPEFLQIANAVQNFERAQFAQAAPRAHACASLPCGRTPRNGTRARFAKQRIVDVVAEVERFARRRAIEQQAQALRVRLSLFHVVHGDRRGEKYRPRPCPPACGAVPGACGR